MLEQEIVRSTRGTKSRAVKGKSNLRKKIALSLATLISCLSFVAVGVIIYIANSCVNMQSKKNVITNEMGCRIR